MVMQTLPVPAVGGLDLVSPPQVLSRNPGAAVVLNNFEPLTEGGYRRINGFLQYSDVPDVIKEDEIRGIAYYKGIVVVVGSRILHSPQPNTWFVVNKKMDKATASAGLPALPDIPSAGTGPVCFTNITVDDDGEVLIITDSEGQPARLLVEGDLYTFTVSTNEDAEGYKYCTKYQDHVVYANGKGKPGSIIVSDRFSPLTFTKSTGGSWESKVADEIVGIHSFRDYLYIFCRNSIYRVVNLESKTSVAIRPVTTKVGCIDGRSIQEIGGDVLFLADDGLRYLGATDRIDDVSINLVSGTVRPITSNVLPGKGPVSSVVIPSKAQYRLFFTDNVGKKRGLIGTLREDGGFSWATTDDLFVHDLTITTEGEDEQIFHLGSPTTGEVRVYYHDVGSTFDGTPIIGRWKVPNFNMGDSAIRKNLHFIDMYLEAEDRAAIGISLEYDLGDPKVIQPEVFHLEPVVEAARFGQAVYGRTRYGATRYPVDPVFLEGSGKWISMTFTDRATTNSPYIIRGYDLQFTQAGRI